MRIALVSREFYPYVGGGIAPIVTAAARRLSRIAEVTVVTSESHREAHEAGAAEGIVPPEVRFAWVPDPQPDTWIAYVSYMHAYSARVHECLRAAYPDRGPDLIEFADYLAEGFVTVQARHTSDPWLARTQVAVRLHTTSEICAVLDGHMPDDFATTAIHDAERFTLRHADRLLWSGGDVLETYRRYYAEPLAPAERIPDAFLEHGDPPAPAASQREGPLRLLYLGRAERRKGVGNLIRAMTLLERDDVHLTLLGGDTDTGPLQTSLRRQLQLMAGDDPRITFLDEVPRSAVSSHIAAADVVVVPSLWECWPNVAREALKHDRPVLGTPVGGLTEMVVEGETGWLARDTSPGALAAAIGRLAEDPAATRRLAGQGAAREHFERLTGEDAFLARYRALVAQGPRRLRRIPRGRPPLVSVVIPYFKLDRHIGETLESVFRQSHPELDVVVVNDGSLRDEDALLYEGRLPEHDRVRVVTQANAGLSAARNTGVALALGDYVLPLDADDIIEPEFVERCVDALERDPELAYVTTWVRFMLPDGEFMPEERGGYRPYGNWTRLIERSNVGGTCASVMRRRLFDGGLRWNHDLASYEDWLLYLELARAGRRGGVIPELLFRYRVRPDSMMRLDGARNVGTIVDEIAAHLREDEVQWIAAS